MIQYRNGYKYQTAADYTLQTALRPAIDISNRFIKLTTDGLLTIREDYAWDGASGPTADSPDSMRASLVHDALYQLMRDGSLDEATYKPKADAIFHDILLEDGMPSFRALTWYRGVQKFGEPSANPANDKPILTAP